VTAFGDRVFKEVIRGKCSHKRGLSNRTRVLIRTDSSRTQALRKDTQQKRQPCALLETRLQQTQPRRYLDLELLASRRVRKPTSVL
jgi:hypothetical protein